MKCNRDVFGVREIRVITGHSFHEQPGYLQRKQIHILRNCCNRRIHTFKESVVVKGYDRKIFWNAVAIHIDCS